MSQSRTSRRGRVRRRAPGKRHRVATGAQAPPQRASQVEVLSAPGAAPPPRAAPRGGELQRRHHADGSARAPRARGPRSSSSRRRSSSLAAASGTSISRSLSSCGGRRGGPAHPARGLLQPLAGHRAGLWSRRAIARPRAAQRRRVRVATLLIRLQGGVEHRREHAVEVGSWVCEETKTDPRRPVELRPLTGATSASASAKRDARSGVVGTPAARSRWRQRRGQAREGRSCRAQARPLTAAARPCPASPPRRGPGSAACRCGATPWLDRARRRPR